MSLSILYFCSLQLSLPSLLSTFLPIFNLVLTLLLLVIVSCETVLNLACLLSAPFLFRRLGLGVVVVSASSRHSAAVSRFQCVEKEIQRRLPNVLYVKWRSLARAKRNEQNLPGRALDDTEPSTGRGRVRARRLITDTLLLWYGTVTCPVCTSVW